MRLSLICGSLKNMRILVHTGRERTNELADEIDKYPWFDVLGTAFARGSSSIHFSSKGMRRQDVANQVAHCMELVFDDPDMHIDIEKVEPSRG